MSIKLKNEKITIKGRGYNDVRKHMNWISKEDTTFSTVYTEGLMLSYMIDKMEGWDVPTADIPGAFLKNDYVT